MLVGNHPVLLPQIRGRNFRVASTVLTLGPNLALIIALKMAEKLEQTPVLGWTN